MSMKNNNRPYHFIIYGATGFTGKYCIEYMLKCMEKQEVVYQWAIAGRSLPKLIATRNEVADLLHTNLENIPIVVADNSDECSLLSMCSQCNVLINCVGPYGLFGEAVVKACIQAKTHQVDITAEIHYADYLHLKYHKQAEEAGVLIVNYCGFGFLIWEVSINYLKDACKPIVFNSVEDYASGMLDGGLHSATFDSLIELFSNLCPLVKNALEVNRRTYTKSLPDRDYPLKRKYIPFYSKKYRGWCTNNYSLQAFLANRVQHYNYIYRDERPTQIGSYFVFPTFKSLIASYLMGIIVFIFTRCRWGARFLLKFSQWFTFKLLTKEGPKREDVLRSSLQMAFVGRGWRNENEMHVEPDVTKVLLVDGPNAGYITTSICAILAAFTIQEEFNTENIPFSGGVLTSGVAFRNTRIVERLERNSFVFTLSDE